jgi:hypothetical protein
LDNGCTLKTISAKLIPTLLNPETRKIIRDYLEKRRAEMPKPKNSFNLLMCGKAHHNVQECKAIAQIHQIKKILLKPLEDATKIPKEDHSKWTAVSKSKGKLGMAIT